MRGYVSTAFGSPFGDSVTPKMVLDVSLKLMEMGCDELSIGDTIGVGVPSQVEALVPLLAREDLRSNSSRCTFTTRAARRLRTFTPRCGSASRKFDASSGGLGGCPYAPGATGNVGTEDVLYLLHQMGIETGVDLEKVRAASRFIAGVVDHALTSKAYQAMEAAASVAVDVAYSRARAG